MTPSEIEPTTSASTNCVTACPLFNRYSDYYRGYSRWRVWLTTHLHLGPKLRMSGSVTSLPLYALMAYRQGQPYSTIQALSVT
jgi:hypothetical protein